MMYFSNSVPVPFYSVFKVEKIYETDPSPLDVGKLLSNAAICI